MAGLRALKVVLACVMVAVFGAAIYISTLISERQETLKQIARYNTSWLASQAVGEFTRFEARLGAFAIPGSGVDRDEVELRFAILQNRVDLMGDGEFFDFVSSSPERREILADLKEAVERLEPIVSRIAEPDAVRQALAVLSPTGPRLMKLASDANRFGADRVEEDQHELLRLHWAFSSAVLGLLAGGMGLIALLIWHNRLLGRTYRALGVSAERLALQSEEIQIVNDELAIRNGRFDAALRNMGQGLCMVDADHRLIVCNQRFLDLFGLDAGTARTGTALGLLVDQASRTSAVPETLVREIFEQQVADAIAGVPSSFYAENGDDRTISVAQRPMADGGWIATYEDVSDRKRAEAQIVHMAHHDALTGLANRVLFRKHLDLVVGRATLEGGAFSVLCLDLDQFKDVNDTLGHPVGDLLLRAVATRLRAALAETDFVARLGGDEFAILYLGDDAGALAARVVETLAAPYDLEGHQVVVGASVGIATGSAEDTPDRLLKNADMALYRAKANGRSSFRFFEPDMDAALQERRALELDLRDAMAAGALELYYQPILDLGRDTVSCCEALMRWRHPTRGFVPPSEFIPIAEETGLIWELGEWTLLRACSQAVTLPHTVRIAVNLSPIQFRNRGLVASIVSILASTGLAPHRLELEITESLLLQHNDATLATLHQLRSLGIRIAMDDFGTGYSSLSYLRSFPFDKIKIDKSFIRELTERADCAAIVRSITDLGASLGMTTTAEGVETREQFDLLREIGCTEVQGFLFSRPGPLEEIRPLVEAHRTALAKAA